MMQFPPGPKEDALALLCQWRSAEENIVFEDDKGVDQPPESWISRLVKSERASILDASINAHEVTKKGPSLEIDGRAGFPKGC